VTPELDHSFEGDTAEAAEDAELGRVLEVYLADLEAGRPADREKLLAEHPAIARQLRACLQVMNLADRMVDGSDSGSRARGSGRRRDSTMTPQGQSGLTALVSGPPPHVHLRDLPDESEPVIKPRSAEMPARNWASLGRYQLQGEIARGGMGAILKGRDVDLGRELALKVLLESHQGNPEVLCRFIEEAQIGGQLQHPGIAPVYELGTFPEPDRRPYFAMKLVKGQTLAALLHERTNPAHDLPRFLAIFEQVCQTMAYAHARGVIHRDLKPSNVMVGSFGEVQVMDWGLAKVLPRGGNADEAAAQAVQETVIMTVRSGSAGSGGESRAGSVLGTPAYMAPEQARGEVERIDERADVFGLGAILCEILTGRPPYVGLIREEIRGKAAQGDLTDALRRLDACAAEAELIELARDCLAVERDERPRNAGEVARRLTAYLAGVQERLKAAELARVEAQARAAEERKRRRLTVALAASVLITASVVGGGWTYLARQSATRRAATERGVTAALAEASIWRDQARKAAATDNLEPWSAALVAVRHARDLAAQGDAEPALAARVEGELIALEREQEEAKADHQLLDKLETIRGRRAEHWDAKQTDAEYAAVFREFGADIDRLDPKEAGAWLAKHTAAVELVSYLDDWAFVRRKVQGTKDQASWRRLIEVAITADPNPWRDALRQQIIRGGLHDLQRLAADEPVLEAQPVASLVLLANALKDKGDTVRAESVLKGAWHREPSDFWVNLALANSSWSVQMARFDRPEEAARHLTATVAIRPQSFAAHSILGDAFTDMGRLDEAIAERRAALRLKPDATHHNNLGVNLILKGQLDEAINEFRAALRLKPDYANARVNLAELLTTRGQLDEAIVEHRALLQAFPDSAEAHSNLGVALRTKGSLNEAVAALRKAEELLRGRSNPNADEIDRELKTTERLVELDRKLPVILAGKARPLDALETLGFARLCHDKKLHGASARFWAEAFQAQAKLADDMKVQNRYNAACDAALAGSGQGKDEPPLDKETMVRWRKQAIVWLKADLTAWSKVLENGSFQVRQAISQTLQHWKADPDLAGLRDATALAKLSEQEQKACRALWAEVDALLAKSRGTNPKSGH